MALLEGDLVVTPRHMALDTGLLTGEEILSRIDELKRDLERLRREIEGPWEYAMLVGSDGTELKIPTDVYEVLLWVIDRVAEGEAFTLAPLHRRLTTQEAADLLNVSRPFLIKLLDRGEIAYTKTGTHRRILLTDVLRYRDEQGRKAEAILDATAEEEKDWRLDDEVPGEMV